MCLNPILLPNGVQVACHKCWQCIRNYVDDWTGRCIAECQTSAGAHSVTMTYGRDDRYGSVDHIAAAGLTYSDVQQSLKIMRLDGLKVRYFVVGEYGAEKGRAHWHCLFFWQDFVPIMEQKKMVDWKYWKHGHTFWQPVTPESVRYVCKYIAKETAGPERSYHMQMSKKPALGDKYFRLLAAQYVEARLAPQDWKYSFDGVLKNGKPWRFSMQGRTRQHFMRYFRDAWWERWGDHPPNSEILEDFEDKEAAQGDPEQARRIIAFEKHGLAKIGSSGIVGASRHLVSKPQRHQLHSWMKVERLAFSEMLNVWLYEFDGEQRPWYWAKDEQGEYGWRAKIGASNKNDSRPGYREARGR